MSSLMCRRLILLACVLLAAGQAGAAGRESGARESAGAAGKTSAAGPDHWRQNAESWLARLKGSFTIKFRTEDKIGNCRKSGTGVQECTRQAGVKYVSAATCRGVDDGPGVYCTFDQLRREASSNGAGDVGARALFSPVNDLPSRMSLGIDPVARKISLMIVDGSALGSLTGNDVTFKGRCDVKESKTPCTWILSIHAPPDGQRILIKRKQSRPNYADVKPDPLLLSNTKLWDTNDLRTFELNRVEQQPPSPRE